MRTAAKPPSTVVTNDPKANRTTTTDISFVLDHPLGHQRGSCLYYLKGDYVLGDPAAAPAGGATFPGDYPFRSAGREREHGTPCQLPALGHALSLGASGRVNANGGVRRRPHRPVPRTGRW